MLGTGVNLLCVLLVHIAAPARMFIPFEGRKPGLEDGDVIKMYWQVNNALRVREDLALVTDWGPIRQQAPGPSWLGTMSRTRRDQNGVRSPVGFCVGAMS